MELAGDKALEKYDEHACVRVGASTTEATGLRVFMYMHVFVQATTTEATRLCVRIQYMHMNWNLFDGDNRRQFIAMAADSDDEVRHCTLRPVRGFLDAAKEPRAPESSPRLPRVFI
jgi:hypothetical protein